MKKLIPVLLLLGLFMFIGCASTDIPNKNGVPLTTKNSVVVYGYWEDLSDIDLLVQASDYNYELIKCEVSNDCFVAKRPVYVDDKIKIMQYETEDTGFFSSGKKEYVYCGIGGYNMSFDKPQIYYFANKLNKDEEKDAIRLALKIYKDTEWAELFNKRLGELKK